MDEKPVPLKRPRAVSKKKIKDEHLYCIIHFQQNKAEKKVRQLTEATFDKVKCAVNIRQNRGKQNEKLSEICSQVPNQYSAKHGVHPWCYKTFMNTSRILKRRNDGSCDSPDPCPIKRRRVSDQAILFPRDRCLFCDKGRIRKSGHEEKLVKCVTKIAEESIKKAAVEKQDHALLLKISDGDLVAREAHYHASCRKNQTRIKSHPSPVSNKEKSQTREKAAHKAAFEYLCAYIDENIIDGSNVERMSMLRERYLQFMMEKSPQFYSASYRTEKVKAKLIKHFGSRIKFWRPNYKSELVFAADVGTGVAIENAFEIASSDLRRLEEAALILRRQIKRAQSEAPTLPWPPPADFLLSDTIQPPVLLQGFLTVLITGKKTDDESDRITRQKMALAQDICHAVSKGQWIMPKHLLLGMSIRHLTGSAELITLVNRFGHCASYSTLLELETAMCKKSVDCRSTIPPTISKNNNVVLHLCWDNFDLNEETPSGAGTTHTAHGIIIQEVSVDGNTSQEISRFEGADAKRSKERSVNFVIPEIEPCFLKDKAEPIVILDIITACNESAVFTAQMSDLSWIFCRAMVGTSTQTVSAWGGWIVVTGASDNEVPELSRVDYMPPIINPITENATVQHILKVSQKASREVGQQYTIVCFDLAVAKKAYALIWQQPQAYADVIVRMGGFHISCAFMGALGKYVRCSGFEEILVESGICASGSIEKVLTGKHYNRAIRVHKIVAEAMERLLLARFEETNEISEEGKAAFKRLAESPTQRNLSETLSNEKCKDIADRYIAFKDRVREGYLGKTAQLWMQYLDFVWMLLRFLRATKENNFALHLASLEDMCSLFFSFDHPNYARYTVVYVLKMLNLHKTHPGAEDLLQHKGISVNRSSIPSSRNAVDITIEQTINRHAKSQGGIIGFSRNYSAYYRWCATRHFRASYLQATMEMADMDISESSHKDCRPSEIARSEETTRQVLQAISNFINPFAVEDADNLYCLSSGAPATKCIENDLLTVAKVGKEARTIFIQERLIDKTKSFNAPISRQNLKTFANLAKSVTVTGATKKTKQLTAERNVFGQLILLSLKHNLSLERVLSYPLGPVPWSLATSDGNPVKTDKSQLIHAIENDTHHTSKPNQQGTTCIIDGCALFQAQVALPTTFGELAERLFDQLPKVERVDFITDKYEALSIKSTERMRRGSSKPHLIKGSSTKVPRDWKTFLSCDKNKQSFISFLLVEWKKCKYATKLQGRKVYFVCGDSCFCLTSYDGLETSADETKELESTQEEADTRIILHCLHSSQECSTNTIIVRSPDTDVFVLLLHFMKEVETSVLFDTGTGNKRRLININQVIHDTGKDFCSALPAVHAYSGCDTTSAFVRKGKKTVLKTLRAHPEYVQTFLELGRTSTLSDDTSQRLEEFTCLLYGGTATSDINTLRHEKFLQKYSPKSGTILCAYSGADMSLLPPCRDALRMHIERANYQALVWYNADKAKPDIPPPFGHGWDLHDGQISITWTGGKLLPEELVNVLTEDPTIQDDNDSPELDNLDDFIFAEN